MKRSSTLWAPLGASLFTHGVIGWNLYMAPPRPSPRPERDVFEVRMVSLPPPPPPEPPAPPPMRIKPPPAAPKPTVAPPLPDQPAEAPEPEAATAPPALLAEGTAASAGGIVQQPFATVSSLASLSGSGRTGPTSAPPARAATGDSLALAKLSDLSRKPRAPSLDASLRQHYPDELRRRGVEGQAEVRVIVSARGRVEHVSVVSETAAGFAQACKNTLLGSQWSEPLDREGKPVNTRLTYRCRFQVGR